MSCYSFLLFKKGRSNMRSHAYAFYGCETASSHLFDIL